MLPGWTVGSDAEALEGRIATPWSLTGHSYTPPRSAHRPHQEFRHCLFHPGTQALMSNGSFVPTWQCCLCFISPRKTQLGV
jgi:hypothetical protein